jgi:hypothetical protein
MQQEERNVRLYHLGEQKLLAIHLDLGNPINDIKHEEKINT